MYQDMLQPDLILLDCQATDREELFQVIAQVLFEKGYVTNRYLSALSEREDRFPTGLQTKYLAIALPHTDPEVIEKPFIFIVRNRHTIEMLQMGDNARILCQHFLFLGIKDPKGQVGLLSRLMEVFSDEAFVARFASLEKEDAMYHLLKEFI